MNPLRVSPHCGAPGRSRPGSLEGRNPQARRIVERPEVLTSPSSRTTRPPCSPRKSPAPSGPLSRAAFREHVGLQRRGRAGASADHASPSGPARGGVDQMVLEVPAGVPEVDVEARGRDGALPDRNHRRRLLGQRMADLDLHGLAVRVSAADPDIAAAIDCVAAIAGEAAARRGRRRVPCPCRPCRREGRAGAESRRPRRAPRSSATRRAGRGGRDGAAAPRPVPR